MSVLLNWTSSLLQLIFRDFFLGIGSGTSVLKMPHIGAFNSHFSLSKLFLLSLLFG